MPSSVAQAGIPPFQGIDARARQIEQCKVAALTAIGLLGPAHALLVGGTGTTIVVVSLLITGAQAFATFSIISAIFVVRGLKKDTDLDPFVVRIPAVCCSIAGTLLVVATCVVHWKAACGIAVLAVVFLAVVHRGTVIDFGKRLVNWSATLFSCVGNTAPAFPTPAFPGWLATGWTTIVSHLRAPPAEGSDLEMGVESGGGEQAA